MFIDERRKIIFIHVAKTGGSSIHIALKDASGWPILDPRRMDPLPPIHHMSAIDLIMQNPQYAGYYKFAVVREPLDRLRSAYTDFLLGADRKGYHLSVKEYNNFEHFCINYPNSEWVNDPHFRPQHEMVCDPYGNIMVDLCKYETLAEDLLKIGGRLGFVENPFLNLQHYRNNKSARSNIDLSLTKETETRIRDFFATDYDKFGYTV